MRSAPGDAWQVMRGEGGRVERKHKGIVRPGVSGAFGCSGLCVWREWIIIESQINISRISISLTCQSFSSFYLCTEIALGGNDVTFSISSNVLASYEARCYATGSFEELKCNCWGALI